MMSSLRHGAVAILLLGSFNLAPAQLAPSKSETEVIDLTPQQRATIYRSVSKQKVTTPPPAEVQITLGSQLPGSVELYSMPDDILSELPAAKQYKYTVWNNQVVLVDPTNMKVVEIIQP